MRTNRRNLMRAGVASLCTIEAASVVMANDTNENATKDQVFCLDYGLSFITNPSPHNQVRFWVESRTTIFDDETDTSMEIYQCGSCKSEHTFAVTNLLHEDNYDFLPILVGSDWLIYRRLPRLSDRYRTIQSAQDVWGKPNLKYLRPGKNVALLPERWEMISEATASAIPIVAQTEIQNEAPSRH